MKRKSEIWKDRINAVTMGIKRLCKDLDKAVLNKKENEDTWSIAQNIDHLIQLNSSYYPIFEALENGNFKLPFAGKLPFVKNFVGDSILRSVEPSRARKMKTFTIWEARSTNIDSAIVADFEHHQSSLIEWIDRLEKWIEERTVIHSPANTKIVYRLDKAFEIIVTHEERHLNQLKELIQMNK